MFICVLAMPVVVTDKIQLQINDRQIAVPTVLFVYCVVGFPYFRPHPKQPRKHRRVEAFSFWFPILAQNERNKITEVLLRSAVNTEHFGGVCQVRLLALWPDDLPPIVRGGLPPRK